MVRKHFYPCLNFKCGFCLAEEGELGGGGGCGGPIIVEGMINKGKVHPEENKLES